MCGQEECKEQGKEVYENLVKHGIRERGLPMVGLFFVSLFAIILFLF